MARRLSSGAATPLPPALTAGSTKEPTVDEQIYDAARRDNLPALQLLVGRRPAPNLDSSSGSRDMGHEGRTALHVACARGYLDVTKFLLDKGASPYSRDPDNRTPLWLAARNGRWNIVKFLLATVKDPPGQPRYVDMSDNRKVTALHAAVLSGLGAAQWDAEVAQGFVKARADFDLQDDRGCTAAHYACNASAEEGSAVPLLTAMYRDEYIWGRCAWMGQAAGAELMSRSCLHMAAANGRADDIEWLLRHVDKDRAQLRDGSKHKMTAWEIACSNEDFERRVNAVGAFILSSNDSLPSAIAFDNSLFWGYFMRVNNQASIFGLLRLAYRRNMPKAVIDLVLRDFQNKTGTRDSILRVREASCTFEILDTGRKAAAGTKKSEEAIKGTNVSNPAATLVEPDYLSLVMPYFQIRSWEQISLWRNAEQRKNLFVHHNKRNYCCSDSPEIFRIYMPLTLDEYCNPALPGPVLERRNGDQVLGWMNQLEQKQLKLTGPADQVPGPPGLIEVGQAWLWSLPNAYIASPAQDRISIGHGTGLEAFGLPKEELFGAACTTGDRLRRVGVALSHLVGSLDRPYQVSPATSILNVFENAINLVAEEVNEYAKELSIKSMNVLEEKKYLHQINDVREELSMIGRVVSEQEDVWKEYTSKAWPEYWSQDERLFIKREHWVGFSTREAKEWRMILQAQTQFVRYRRRIAQLDEDAERVERSILIQLDLKQKHASVKESHAAATMSAAVVGFTVITIIFTPLSFIVGLFALPIDSFQRYQKSSPYTNGTSLMYTRTYIGKFAATTGLVSTFVTLVLMWAAIVLFKKQAESAPPVQNSAHEGREATHAGSQPTLGMSHGSQVRRDIKKRVSLGASVSKSHENLPVAKSLEDLPVAKSLEDLSVAKSLEDLPVAKSQENLTVPQPLRQSWYYQRRQKNPKTDIEKGEEHESARDRSQVSAGGGGRTHSIS